MEALRKHGDEHFHRCRIATRLAVAVFFGTNRQWATVPRIDEKKA